MDAGIFNEVCREALYVLILLSAPVLVLSLVIGILISLFQALTQIQESTLTFVPKLLAVYLGMFMIMPYMFSKLQIFTDHLIQYVIRYGGVS
jgi:flagellar biosynthetic protein FliQ